MKTIPQKVSTPVKNNKVVKPVAPVKKIVPKKKVIPYSRVTNKPMKNPHPDSWYAQRGFMP